MKIVFLEAAVPLTKQYTKTANGVTKTPYPFVWEFTSHEEQFSNLSQLEALLKKHSALNHCALKGVIDHPLVKESRAGSTDSNSTTEWLVLDLDGLPDNIEVKTSGDTSTTIPLTIDLFLEEMGLGNISYIVQWSASYGVNDQKLRAHVFMLLDKPYAAPLIKQWLIQKNHEVPLLNQSMGLTKTGNSISWPLDISACQNDKLIYIAPPVLKGIKDPMGKEPRIKLVKKKFDLVQFDSVINSSAKNRELNHKKISELREISGLPARKYKYKVVGSQEVMLQPDESVITDMKVERGFVYFNLNGGDSWAYYHPENKPDYILNFKGEPAYLTKELLPDYWQQLTNSGSSTRQSSDGVLYLAFLDRRTGVYWRGTYDQTTDNLDINPAKNETQLRHFAKQYGVPIGDFVPEWDLVFDPTDLVRVDVQNRVVNRFQPSSYMLNAGKPPKSIPPTIAKVINHALGNDKDILDHFINWLATIVQTRNRTRTAWVLHGTEGCLAGDTVIEFSRGKRNGGRPLTIKQAYEKWSGTYKLGQGMGKSWQQGVTTRAKAVKDGMTIGYHEVYDIVEAGVKQLYKLTASNGRSIRVTDIHPFMRPDGSFTELKDLKPGDEIVFEGTHNTPHYRGGRRARETVYSVRHHPHAWKQMVGGKNYKRIHRARLVYEAHMNGITYEEMLDIVRNDAERAKQLHYLPSTDIVHHRDEDPMNDALDNLVAIDKANHDAHHAKEVGLGTITTRIVKVKSITPDKIEMTYDMTMKAPYQNYIANGFAVHNTGKGVLISKILKPMFGNHVATRRMEELSEKYNQFMENSFIVFVDEVQTRALQNEQGVMAKLRNFITEETVPIRQMYSNGIETPNYTNWIFSSNMPDPVSIKKGDRRFNVGKYQPDRLYLTDEEVDVKLGKEVQAFYNYLHNYKADFELAGRIIESHDRDILISISENSVDTVGNAMMEGKFDFLLDQMPTDDSHKRNAASTNRVADYTAALVSVIRRTDPLNGKCNITREELRTIFDYCVGNMPTSPNKFTSLLKHHRIHLEPVWIDGRTVRGMKVQWKDYKDFKTYLEKNLGVAPQVAKPAAKKAKATA